MIIIKYTFSETLFLHVFISDCANKVAIDLNRFTEKQFFSPFQGLLLRWHNLEVFCFLFFFAAIVYRSSTLLHYIPCLLQLFLLLLLFPLGFKSLLCQEESFLSNLEQFRNFRFLCNLIHYIICGFKL